MRRAMVAIALRVGQDGSPNDVELMNDPRRRSGAAGLPELAA